jgi:nitronate monooxygenase
VAVIRNTYVDRLGLRAGTLARLMLKNRRTKHLMRGLYALRSLRQLKHASLSSRGAQEYWQAGKSVDGIRSVEPAGAIVRRFAAALPD